MWGERDTNKVTHEGETQVDKKRERQGRPPPASPVRQAERLPPRPRKLSANRFTL